jgi:hypothetical protein
MRKPEVRPLVRLRWVDSANLFGDRWASVDELDVHDGETFCETVGWVVGENDHSVYVAGSVAPEEIGSVMQIPLCAVRSRVTLSADRLAL